MTVEVTNRRMSAGGTRSEHITDVKWRNPATGSTGESTKAQMVDYIDVQKGSAYVQGRQSRSQVGTVHEQGKTPYLRTYANGQWDDNLLSLPPF
jgi:hypothetical protein